jgi:general secretion pathway protein M
MSSAPGSASVIARYPSAAAALYGLLLILLLAAAWSAVTSVLEQRAALDAATDLLARLEGGRGPVRTADGVPEAVPPAGSPFLEGPTLTVAGAALLQRVAGAVTRAGGSVLSSQVDVQGPQAASGQVALTASCEVDMTAVQQVLYDLEAGMPFLFIDNLVAQAPLPTTAGAAGRMRLVMSVSGQWERSK